MPKLAVPLTDLQLKRAKPRDKPFKLFDGAGMYLEIFPSGTKLWRMKFRQANGKENLLAFGPYPEVRLSEAREQRSNARHLLREGVDPGRHRDEGKRAAAVLEEHTFSKIAVEWHALKVKSWSPAYSKNVDGTIPCASPMACP